MKGLAFTKQELLVIRFLLVTFGLGLAFTAYKGVKREKAVERFNESFAAETREFQRRLRDSDSMPASSEIARQDIVDVNKADAGTLDRLPGIGPVLAERIVEYRRAHGRFRTIDEITLVRGIGERTLTKLRGRITVDEIEEEGQLPPVPGTSENAAY